MDIKFLGIGFLRREHGPLSTHQLIKSCIESNKNEKGNIKQVSYFWLSLDDIFCGRMLIFTFFVINFMLLFLQVVILDELPIEIDDVN